MVGKYKKTLLISLSVFILTFTLGTLSNIPVNAATKPGACSEEDKSKGGVDVTSTIDGREEKSCDIPDDAGTGTGTGTTEDQDEGLTCAIEKVGWMLCPVIESAGKVGDQAFQFLAKNFLETEPELVADNSGTKYAWDLARNIANILFIIAFLVIIYSQVTGAGISNYGIKRMMPRLIIAALAVNTSYYICQGMVDLTNILGYEIQNFMIETAREVTTSAAMPPAQKGFMDNQTTNGVLGTIAAGALGLTIAWAILPVLLLGIGTVVITCLVIIIILLLRKAFIVLLVVLAPIAFVAYLLPNTEKYFQKWLNMFWQLLLVFPVVALLFGAGQLASAVILVAGMSEPFYQGGEKCVVLPQGNATEATLADCPGGGVAAEERAGTDDTGPVQSGGATPFMLGLVAAGIAVAPLLAVWAVLKGALGAAGALGGKISGAVQSAGARSAGRAKKAEDALRGRVGDNMKGGWQRMQAKGIGEDGQPTSLAGRYAKQRAFRKARLKLSEGALERAQQNAISSELGGENGKGEGSAILSGLPTNEKGRAVASAQAALDKITVEQMQAASVITQSQSDEALHATLDGAGSSMVNDPMVAAAIQELSKRQDFAGLQKALDKFGASGAGVVTRTLSSGLKDTGLFTGGQLGNVSLGNTGGESYASMVDKNIAGGILSPEAIASTGPSALEEASRLAVSQAARRSLINSAHQALNDPILNKKIGRNKSGLDNLSQGKDAKTGNQW